MGGVFDIQIRGAAFFWGLNPNGWSAWGAWAVSPPKCGHL